MNFKVTITKVYIGLLVVVFSVIKSVNAQSNSAESPSKDTEILGKADIRFTIGTRGRTSISVNFGLGISRRIDNFQWGINGALNVYSGELGSPNGGQRPLNGDLVTSFSITWGDGLADSLPLATFNHLNSAAVFNYYQKSITHAQNFVFSFRDRHQRVGMFGFKLDRFYLQTYNDVDILIGDGEDRYWTGGGSLSVALEDGRYLKLGTDVFTGLRDPTHSSHPQVPPRGRPFLYYDQSLFDFSLNMGKTYLQLRSIDDDFNFEVSRTGWRDMGPQNLIHAVISTPWFESGVSNSWNVGVSYQKFNDDF